METKSMVVEKGRGQIDDFSFKQPIFRCSECGFFNNPKHQTTQCSHEFNEDPVE